MAKLKECPECSGNLSDEWQPQRKLRQSCRCCDWKGELRTPETKEIKSIKTISAHQSYGFCYEIFDKYGHIISSSRSFNTKGEAISKLKAEIEEGKVNKHAGPFTGVLWPPAVEVSGKIFK